MQTSLMRTNPNTVSFLSYALSKTLNGKDLRPETRMVSLASLLIAYTDEYEMQVEEVLHEAYNRVYSGESGNMQALYKNIVKEGN